MEDTVEVIEIWRPVESGGEVVSMRSGRSQNMKLVAYLVGGHVIKLEEDFMLKKSAVTTTTAKQITSNSNAQAALPPQDLTQV